MYKSGKFLVTAGLLTVASIGLSVHSVNADEVPSSATKTDVAADTINEQVKGAVVENPNNGKSYYFDADLGNGTQI